MECGRGGRLTQGETDDRVLWVAAYGPGNNLAFWEKATLIHRSLAWEK